MPFLSNDYKQTTSKEEGLSHILRAGEGPYLPYTLELEEVALSRLVQVLEEGVAVVPSVC
jgi:hypothetical protein